MTKIDSDFLHLIVTRYNVGLYDRSKQYNSEVWMEYRLPIFTGYCLPSILNQTCKDFLWLVLIDNRTPREWLDRIVPLLSEPNMIPVFVDCNSSGGHSSRSVVERAIRETTRRFMPETVLYLVINNLDNDDFLSVDFVGMVHETLRDGVDVPCVLDPEFIYNIREPRMTMKIGNLQRRRQNCQKRKKRQKRKGDGFGRSGFGVSPYFITVEDRCAAIVTDHWGGVGSGHLKILRFIPKYVIIEDCCVGRIKHAMNLSPNGRSSHTNADLITNDIITDLVGKFGIDPIRITDLCQTSCSK